LGFVLTHFGVHRSRDLQLSCVIIAGMAKDPIKNLKPASPAHLEELEWQRRSEESKKTHRKPRRASTAEAGKKSRIKR
jgi:hypothetical protein